MFICLTESYTQCRVIDRVKRVATQMLEVMLSSDHRWKVITSSYKRRRYQDCVSALVAERYQTTQPAFCLLP